jgi:hypothetical protein
MPDASTPFQIANRARILENRGDTQGGFELMKPHSLKGSSVTVTDRSPGPRELGRNQYNESVTEILPFVTAGTLQVRDLALYF